MKFFVAGALVTCLSLIANNVLASTLYITDDEAIYYLNKNNEVGIFKQGIHPSIVNIDHNGNLSYWDYSDSTLYSITPSGISTPLLNLPGVGVAAYTYDGAGNLYIADQRNRSIRKYDGSGNQLWEQSNSAIGFGIAVDLNGYIYVGGVGDHNVHVFDQAGNVFTHTINAGSSNPRPHYLDESNTLYATSASDGKVLRALFSGGQHANFSEFSSEVWWANDVVSGQDGFVYAVSTYPVDPGIFVFDTNGTLQTKIESDLFSYPRSLVFGPDVVTISEPPTLLLIFIAMVPFFISIRSRARRRGC